MKVGILTLPLHTNYGGILQAYALQTILERKGHKVVILNRPQYKKMKTYRIPFAYMKRFVKKYFLGKDIHIRQEQYLKKTYPIISQHTQAFIDKYIRYVDVYELSNLHEKDFDVIIVGSDQIWRLSYNKKIEDAYLNFAKTWNIKRIAYAASFGTDEWQYTSREVKRCGELIHHFDAVSMREESGIVLCKKYFDVDAEHVLDPTMLLETKDYVKLMQEANIPSSKGNLLTYILDETPEKNNFVQKIARQKGLTAFQVNNPQVYNMHVPVERRIQPPIEQWLRGFYDADFVVTDSFHACVFSIIFNKPFIAIGNKERGMARFLSLLKMFGLEDRLITDLTGEISVSGILDVDKLQQKLKELRETSFAYLFNHL